MSASNFHIGQADRAFQVRFESLFVPGRAMVFPCDSAGKVSLADMPQRAQDNYLSARARIGRDFAFPRVVPTA